MTLLENKDETRLNCFHCDGKKFNLKDRSRIYENVNGKSKPTNSWHVLLECQDCRFSTTQVFEHFPFEERLMTHLRQQRIIGSKKMKSGDGYWEQEWGTIPWDDKVKQYRPDKLKWFRRG